MAKEILKRLNANIWPIKFNNFPMGTCLVGGAIRDVLLKEESIISDFDFVVPINAIDLCKNFSKKYGGTTVVLDNQRDIARYIINDWKIDVATQIGHTLHEDLMSRDYTNKLISLNRPPVPKYEDPANGICD